ncbi:Pkinase-domain-containing protein [Rhizoclosmatium globosum]|uniref:Pkinase-domain-containing protein n=1 Tax=Rhizoclosmatium globosum TaxID=329046 RepID=A0A1Y2CCR0_9FUNG|nr:Pkinase-domain-containing protein [Rhizoclosmatium globosum]|eukprot:ORY44687.1 Pkinase-domain-containing protein [Rhizoclosmatium globosum]
MNQAFTAKYTPNHVLLGSGGFGFVTTANRVTDGIEVAVKFILKEKVPPNAWARDPILGLIPTEVYILRNVHHVNIIQYLDYYEDKIFLYLVTELHGGSWGGPSLLLTSTLDSQETASSSSSTAVNGSILERRNSCDLFECIEFYQRFNEDQARHVFRQIVSAVAYLASKKIIHRDIKDENILIDRDFNVKLIDFGSATLLDAEGNVVDGLFLGTLQYAAPEILSGKPYRGTECEVWSLGCCLYIMLAGEAPFESPSDVIKPGRPLAPRTELSQSVTNLIMWMLEKNPQSRATVRDVLRHPWVVGSN